MQSLTKKLSNWSIGKPYWDWQWPLVLKVRKSILLRWWVVAGPGLHSSLQHSLTALSATLQTLHHDNIGHLDIWTLVTWRHVSTHWTLDTQATTLLLEGVRRGWSGLDFYDLASRGAVRWLACLVPRQVNIMELLHILHVATWPIMSTRREEGWMEQRRGG